MKQFIGKAFNLFIYINLAWAVLSFGYVSLPIEYQFLNELPIEVLLISGGSTTLIGTFGLYFKTVLNKHGIETNDKVALALEKQLELKKGYESLSVENKALKSEVTALNTKQERIIKLLETELKTKLSNQLIDEFAKELIEGVLDEK